MDDRQKEIRIDLSAVRTSEELQDLLARSLKFPDFYGRNWDAFRDAITGLVEMPRELVFKGWETFLLRLPDDAAHLRLCLEHMEQEFPEQASSVDYA